jgi:glutamate-1-semialdehyde 2,1-aminomutase
MAAFGGKKEIMEIIGHGVAQGGTFNNNKPGLAGAYATLKLIKEQPILETIARRGRRLMDGLMQIFGEQGIPACINGFPAMFSFSVGVEKVTDQRSWDESDHDYYLRLVEKATELGVMPDHDPREPWFLCYSHADQEIDKTLEVMRHVIKLVER